MAGKNLRGGMVSKVSSRVTAAHTMQGNSSPFISDFVPSFHPDLFKGHVVCDECMTKGKPKQGIVKIGKDQSTSNLKSHIKRHHRAKFEQINDGIIQGTNDKANPYSAQPASIKDQPGFIRKRKVEDSKALYKTGCATLAVEEGLAFRTFARPAFRRLFDAVNREAEKIVNVSADQVRDEVMSMGRHAKDATKMEMKNRKVSWTSDHWTGPDGLTYTTVTAHCIDEETWKLISLCLDFKVFEGSTSGERIYNDIADVLQNIQTGEDHEDTIVFDTIGITDTTGNMGKLGQCLRDNNKEHGYCTDHNLHLVAKLAFDRKSDFLH